MLEETIADETKPTTEPEAVPEETPFEDLSPESRARGIPEGYPAVLADGRTWLLHPCGLADLLAEERNRIYDESVLTGNVAMEDIYRAARVALHVNYRLTEAEDTWLVACVLPADLDDFLQAVGNALLPTTILRRTFDDWAYSALYANGLEPSAIPESRLPHVLDQLVRTGRAVPQNKYIDSAVAASKIGNLRGLIAPAPKPAQDPLLKTE